MPYIPPSGWLESTPPRHSNEGPNLVFHRDRDCIAIGDPRSLAATDRPLGALRCRRCGGPAH